MKTKSGVTVLVVIALLLAAVAVGMNMSDSSEEVATTLTGNVVADSGAGQAKVTILPPKVEDKLNEGSTQR